MFNGANHHLRCLSRKKVLIVETLILVSEACNVATFRTKNVVQLHLHESLKQFALYIIFEIGLNIDFSYASLDSGSLACLINETEFSRFFTNIV